MDNKEAGVALVKFSASLGCTDALNELWLRHLKDQCTFEEYNKAHAAHATAEREVIGRQLEAIYSGDKI